MSSTCGVPTRLIAFLFFGWLAESVQSCPLNVTVGVFQTFGPEDRLQHNITFSRDESLIGTATVFTWHQRIFHDPGMSLALANQVFVIRAI